MKVVNDLKFSEKKDSKELKAISALLECNLIWVMKAKKDSISIFATDDIILNHYIDNKYYLVDPDLNLKKNKQEDWQINLGTYCNSFRKSDFIYDLRTLFNISEFVSITKNIDGELFLFRIFSTDDRFVFMSNLVKFMPTINRLINKIVAN